MNTNELQNKKIWISRQSKKHPDQIKKLGRVHELVFHPKRQRLVGFLVKRPDIAWMFRREDAFVGIDGFDLMEDDSGKSVLVVKDASDAIGKGALKKQGVRLEECLLWIGLPAISENGVDLGIIDSVEFDPKTGDVIEMTIGRGVTNDALLGRLTIPASLIKGFRIGVGSKLNVPETLEGDEIIGAIVVDDEATAIPVSGGVAEKAGKASAVAIDKVQKTSVKVKEKVSPKIDEAGTVVKKGVEKGAFATGRQIGRATGMFKGFKDEFKKSMNGEDE